MIAGTDSARAEAERARQEVAAAFERVTNLQDETALLDQALGRLGPEVEHFKNAVRAEEEVRILAAVRERRPQFEEALVTVAAEVTIARLGGGLHSVDLPNLSLDLGEAITAEIRRRGPLWWQDLIKERVRSIRDVLRETALVEDQMRGIHRATPETSRTVEEVVAEFEKARRRRRSLARRRP